MTTRKKYQLPSPRIEKHNVILSGACKQFLKFSLLIFQYGRIRTETNNPQGERFSHYERLNYIVKGHPYYIDHGQRIDLEPGCLVYLQPNNVLKIEEGKEPLELIFINFELGSLEARDEFYEFMQSLFPNSHVHDKNNEFLHILEAIEQIGKEEQLGAALEIQNHFENLMLHIIRSSAHMKEYHPPKPTQGADALLNAAMRFINANIHRNFQLSDMAGQLNVSENYLYKIFVKHTGKSPMSFITYQRMDLAKSSLANPGLSIKTIAANLGYGSPSHFSNAFKKATGESPAAYRRRIRQ